jgi:putative ABC transport system permease protein
VIIISKQLDYMQSRDLGFNKDQKLVIPFKEDRAQNSYDAFANEIAKLKDVSGVTGCRSYPSRAILSDFLMYKSGKAMTDARMVKINRVDDNFFKVMGIRLLAGRNLTPADTTNQVIASESVLKVLDIPLAEAVGARIHNERDGNKFDYDIVGVVNDANFNSLKMEVEPLISFYSDRPDYMIVNASSDNYNSLIADIGSVWKKTIPGVPFGYSFMDQDLQSLYAEENTLKKISNSFTVLAILISCLGLFGLAMFTAQQRIKEIGVRKVLGASVTGIVSMLSKDFLKLVFISIVVGSPIAWWLMDKWLQDFAYKIPISWWIFVLAGIVALVIALITVSFQAIKAAVANPVKSLRTE